MCVAIHAFESHTNCIFAEHILHWGKEQACTDPEAFTEAMIEMFNVECKIETQEGIELDKAIFILSHLVSQPESTWINRFQAKSISTLLFPRLHPLIFMIFCRLGGSL